MRIHLHFEYNLVGAKGEISTVLTPNEFKLYLLVLGIFCKIMPIRVSNYI